MATSNIVCAGPGPHIPASGILGTSDKPGADVRCASPSCAKPVDPAITNRADFESKLTAALAANLTYNNLASASTAQNTAQIKALTKQVSALIRIELGKLDDTSGT